MSRTDQYSVSLVIDGVNLGIWDKLDGGATDSDELKYSPGAMQPQVSLGGKRTSDNIVISRLYDQLRDHPRTPWLRGRCGRGQVVAIKQPLDVDGNVVGTPEVYYGTLKRCLPPSHDSQSTDAALIELEVTVANIV